MKYLHPIKSNDFHPRQPFDDEFDIIRDNKCIHCGKLYDGTHIVFTVLGNGEIIYWHNYTCV
jgi:hypothetical protein